LADGPLVATTHKELAHQIRRAAAHCARAGVRWRVVAFSRSYAIRDTSLCGSARHKTEPAHV
jgi:hypothetical protein